MEQTRDLARRIILSLLVIFAIPGFCLSMTSRSADQVLIYILRRFLYAIPILLTVNVLTFILFFVVNSPDDMARLHRVKSMLLRSLSKNGRQAEDMISHCCGISTKMGLQK